MKTLEYEDNKKILDFQPCTSKYIFRMKTLEYEDNKNFWISRALRNQMVPRVLRLALVLIGYGRWKT